MRVRVCAHACACVRVCVRACMCVYLSTYLSIYLSIDQFIPRFIGITYLVQVYLFELTWGVSCVYLKSSLDVLLREFTGKSIIDKLQKVEKIIHSVVKTIYVACYMVPGFF